MIITRRYRMGSAIAALAVAIAASALHGCGGGGGVPDNPSTPAVPSTPASAPASSVTTPSNVPTVLQGVYAGTSAGREFVSAVTPDRDWFALYFLTGNPEIYSGRISMGVDGAAEIAYPGLLAFQNGRVQSASAKFSGASAQTYRMDLKNISAADGQPLSVTALALAPLGSLQGNWTGTWSDANSSTMLARVTISGQTDISFGGTVNYCAMSATLAPMPGTLLLRLDLRIARLTGCARSENQINGVTLSGVAFAYALPQTGNLRLEMLAVDSSGSGISFRAERQP